MKTEEIFSKLCVYDSRNPLCDEMCEDFKREPRTDCYCDNCYYGRDKMAREIIKLEIALRGAQSAMRKALPFCPPDKEAVYVGEWLDEVNEALAPEKN